jgi:hypothetical protein
MKMSTYLMGKMKFMRNLSRLMTKYRVKKVVKKKRERSISISLFILLSHKVMRSIDRFLKQVSVIKHLKKVS